MGAMLFGLRTLARSPIREIGRRVALPLLVLGTSACYRAPVDARANGSWTYDVEAPTENSRVVTVEATFEGAHTERLGLPHESVPWIKDVRVRAGDGYRTVERRGNEWFERSCNWRCTVRYRIDLGELAQSCSDEVDCARRVGTATLSPALAWLVHPVPRTDVPVKVRVHTTDGAQFATGMNAIDESGTTFGFRSFDLDEGSFTAFGPMRHFRIDVPGTAGKRANIDVAVLGRAPYAMSDETMRSWIEESANATVPLFGRFPVDRTTLFVVPARGESEVVFGKVLSLAGASVVVVVGDRMPGTARHHDWVLVHELFHLGFPTFRGEGRWLGEGLATYYEPILRARAGWMTDAEVFRQFARNMPRGQGPRGSNAGLSVREDLDAIYWGGALFCLAADVRIREETRGKKSLDDVLRVALAKGGDATHVWTVRDVVELGDQVTGTTVLSEMYQRHAARGEQIDLETLLSSLGVTADSREPDETRPLAWIRREIVNAEGRSTVAHRP
jgi:predicted metalloprotease with PDZ domain